MTDDEHRAAAMLLGGEPYYSRGLFLARIYKGNGNYAGTALYDYVDTVTSIVIHSNRSEIKRSVSRLSSDLFHPETPTKIGFD